jgi:hypothetical protein
VIAAVRMADVSTSLCSNAYPAPSIVIMVIN